MHSHRPFTACLLASVLTCTGCATDPTPINRQAGPPARLIVHVEGIDSTDGQLLTFVHDNPRSYHSDDNTTSKDFQAFRVARTTPVVPATQVVFENLPAGRYAVNGYHDEDGDGALDRMIFPFPGMPSEPYGIANGAAAPLSKASFDDALIEVRPPVTEITLRLSTHLGKLVGQ